MAGGVKKMAKKRKKTNQPKKPIFKKPAITSTGLKFSIDQEMFLLQEAELYWFTQVADETGPEIAIQMAYLSGGLAGVKFEDKAEFLKKYRLGAAHIKKLIKALHGLKDEN